MAHWEWNIDPLRLLRMAFMWTPETSSCALEHVRGHQWSHRISCQSCGSCSIIHCLRSSSGVCLRMTSSSLQSAVQLKEKYVQIHKLQLSWHRLYTENTLFLETELQRWNWGWQLNTIQAPEPTYLYHFTLFVHIPPLLDPKYPIMCQTANEQNWRRPSWSCGSRSKGVWRCSWVRREAPRGLGRDGEDEGAKRRERRHHAYGCYGRTRWDGGSDIVKKENTCVPAPLASPLCDQSA